MGVNQTDLLFPADFCAQNSIIRDSFLAVDPPRTNVWWEYIMIVNRSVGITVQSFGSYTKENRHNRPIVFVMLAHVVFGSTNEHFKTRATSTPILNDVFVV